MVGSIRGAIVHRADSWVIIETKDGVGYRIFTGNQSLPEAEVMLFTYHHVREDVSDLYGFLSYPELAMFETLLGVSGVGPKMSANILTHLGRDTIIDAISTNQPAIFKSVSGVGQRVAEKIIVELKSKIGQVSVGTGSGTDSSDIIEALTNLGYHQTEIISVIKQLDASADTSERLKQALKLLVR